MKRWYEDDDLADFVRSKGQVFENDADILAISEDEATADGMNGATTSTSKVKRNVKTVGL